MKLAYFTDTYKPQVNGLVTSIATSKAELEKMGHEVLVFAPDLKGELEEAHVYRLAGMTYFPQPEYTWVFPWGKGFSLLNFRKFAADIVHSHATFGAGLVALAIAWRHRLPLVMTYHTLWEDYLHYVPLLPRRFVRWVNRAYTRWMCNRCALVIAPTKAIKAVLEGYGGRCRIEVLPTGLSADVFEMSGATKGDFGVPEGALLFASAGRLGREKGFDVVLRALAGLGGRIGDWRLAIAGDGPDRGQIEALARELGVEGRLLLLGYVPRARAMALMEAADLFTFASTTETQGMVVIEAMGRGTPVVGCDAMGVGMMMAGSRGGWLARPHDPADFGAKVLEAATDKEAYARKKAEALALAREYAAGAINAKLAGYYEEIAAKTKA